MLAAALGRQRGVSKRIPAGSPEQASTVGSFAEGQIGQCVLTSHVFALRQECTFFGFDDAELPLCAEVSRFRCGRGKSGILTDLPINRKVFLI